MNKQSTNENVSPRRRFHRPGERSYVASHHVPVLTGLPAVGVERFRKQSKGEPPTAAADDTTVAELASTAIDETASNPQTDTPATAVTPLAQHQNSESRIREMLYTVGGTLVAFLLIYLAVSRINSPTVSATNEPEPQSTFTAIPPTNTPQTPRTTTQTSAQVPAVATRQPLMAAAEGTVVPVHDWAENTPQNEHRPATNSQFVTQEVYPDFEPEIPRVAEAPVRTKSTTKTAKAPQAKLQKIEPTIATPTPQPEPIHGVNFVAPTAPEDATAELNKAEFDLEAPLESRYPSTSHSQVPAIAPSAKPVNPLHQPTTTLYKQPQPLPSTASGIREAKLKGSIQPFSTK